LEFAPAFLDVRPEAFSFARTRMNHRFEVEDAEGFADLAAIRRSFDVVEFEESAGPCPEVSHERSHA
jgi:hypothetical protein